MASQARGGRVGKADRRGNQDSVGSSRSGSVVSARPGPGRLGAGATSAGATIRRASIEAPGDPGAAKTERLITIPKPTAARIIKYAQSCQRKMRLSQWAISLSPHWAASTKEEIVHARIEINDPYFEGVLHIGEHVIGRPASWRRLVVVHELSHLYFAGLGTALSRAIRKPNRRLAEALADEEERAVSLISHAMAEMMPLPGEWR